MKLYIEYKHAKITFKTFQLLFFLVTLPLPLTCLQPSQTMHLTTGKAKDFISQKYSMRRFCLVKAPLDAMKISEIINFLNSYNAIKDLYILRFCAFMSKTNSFFKYGLSALQQRWHGEIFVSH